MMSLLERIIKKLEFYEDEKRKIQLKLDGLNQEVGELEIKKKDQIEKLSAEFKKLNELRQCVYQQNEELREKFGSVVDQCVQFHKQKTPIVWFYFSLIQMQQKIAEQYDVTFSGDNIVQKNNFFLFKKQIYELIILNKQLSRCSSYKSVQLFAFLKDFEVDIVNSTIEQLDKFIGKVLSQINFPMVDDSKQSQTRLHHGSPLTIRFVQLLHFKLDIYQHLGKDQIGVFSVLVCPFITLFDVHFNGSYQTNDVNHPELFLKQVYYWILDNTAFFDDLQIYFEELSSIKIYFVQMMSNILTTKLKCCLDSIDSNFQRIYYFDQIIYYYQEIAVQYPCLVEMNCFVNVYTCNNCCHLSNYLTALKDEIKRKLKLNINEGFKVKEENDFAYFKTHILKRSYFYLPTFLHESWELIQIAIKNIELIINCISSDQSSTSAIDDDGIVYVPDMLALFLDEVICNIVNEMDSHATSIINNSNTHKMSQYMLPFSYLTLGYGSTNNEVPNGFAPVTVIILPCNTLYFFTEQIEKFLWCIKCSSTIRLMDAIIDKMCKKIHKYVVSLNKTIQTNISTILKPYKKYDWEKTTLDLTLLEKLQAPESEAFIHFLNYLRSSLLDQSYNLHPNFIRDAFLLVFNDIENYLINDVVWTNKFNRSSSVRIARDVTHFFIPLIDSYANITAVIKLSQVFQKLNEVLRILSLPPNDLTSLLDVTSHSTGNDNILTSQEIIHLIKCRIDVKNKTNNV